MDDALTVQFLPSQEGDAILLRWGESNQMLIDMGTDGIGTAIRERLLESNPRVNLLVVTHIDADHIGGVVSGVLNAPSGSGLSIDEIWFNGHVQTHGVSPHQEGIALADDLSDWLGMNGSILWNRTGTTAPEWGDRVELQPGGLQTRTIDGLTITVLGPTRAALEALAGEWNSIVSEGFGAPRPREPKPLPMKPRLDTDESLVALANSHPEQETTPPNEASIVLLIEWEGRRLLFTGDALGNDVKSGIEHLAKQRSELFADGALQLDLVKVPHHGSENNTSREFVDAVTSRLWVITTNGQRYSHPDAPAVARILDRSSRHGSDRVLAFNEPSKKPEPHTFNKWWADTDWQDRFEYTAVYGDTMNGLTVTLTKDSVLLPER